MSNPLYSLLIAHTELIFLNPGGIWPRGVWRMIFITGLGAILGPVITALDDGYCAWTGGVLSLYGGFLFFALSVYWHLSCDRATGDSLQMKRGNYIPFIPLRRPFRVELAQELCHESEQAADAECPRRFCEGL